MLDLIFGKNQTAFESNQETQVSSHIQKCHYLIPKSKGYKGKG